MQKRITLEELKRLAKLAKYKINKIYLHWSAGRYHEFYDEYHLNIDADGAVIVTTNDLTEYLPHTWMRNNMAIGISASCAYQAKCYADGSVDFGDYPPTAEQIDSMAKVVAVLSNCLALDINKNVVMTHAEAANLDGYGPQTTCERWDLWKLKDLPGDGFLKDGGNIIRGKAIWWQNQGV